jgi:CheY-like chemotaxis protein
LAGLRSDTCGKEVSLEVEMPTVLVVEDEAIIRDIVAEELEDAGFTVVMAINADHAISILENRLDIHRLYRH